MLSNECKTFFPYFKILETNRVFDLPKGQLISKCLFGVFNFFQKMNKNKSTWGIVLCSKVEFIRSFFGRIHDLTICFRVLLTFTFHPTLIFLLADQILDTLNSDSFEKYVHLYNTQSTSYEWWYLAPFNNSDFMHWKKEWSRHHPFFMAMMNSEMRNYYPDSRSMKSW